jgi:hypothetical protein
MMIVESSVADFAVRSARRESNRSHHGRPTAERARDLLIWSAYATQFSFHFPSLALRSINRLQRFKTSRTALLGRFMLLLVTIHAQPVKRE